MRARIAITPGINERLQPTVESAITGGYNINELVDVSQAVIGKDYDADNIWYRLSNGNYLWSGGVELLPDGSDLAPKNRLQFLFSYRERYSDGTVNLISKQAPSNLYFNSILFPGDVDSVWVEKFTPDQVSAIIMNEIDELQDDRKHVFIYIHGYQLFSSLKLDLFASFVQNYMGHESNKIAKVLFFAWPGQGGVGRKSVDDRSIEAGQKFTKNGLFSYFENLSARLKERDMKLNLIVHSFGNQLLNGMINSDSTDKFPKEKIFENIFLMAPDITHLAAHKNKQPMNNYYGDNNFPTYQYHLADLSKIANKVHVFYDRYDYLLYISTKKFVGKRLFQEMSPENLEEIKRYRNLGNYGQSQINLMEQLQGFTFWNVEELIKRKVNASHRDFPFKEVRDGLRNHINDIWDNDRFDTIDGGKTIWNLQRFPNRHRYLFTCKQVVDKVQELLF